MKHLDQIKKFTLIFIFLLVLIKVQILSGCAVIIPPSGGPRDSLPPVLLSASPRDSTLNFKANRIVLGFDEFVDLSEVQNNLVINPTFEHNPIISTKLRTITIRIKDTLQANTTYTINFGNAIRDVNEANILRNFTYIFSTGPGLDTLHYQGNVVVAETGAPDSTLLVVLHKDLSDSAVILKRPPYIAKVDNKGNFQFVNLPNGTFALYAIGEAALSKKYQNKTSLFAFGHHPITIGQSGPDTLYAYRETAKLPTLPGLGQVTTPAAGKNTTNDKRLRFTTNAMANQVDLLKDLILTFPTKLKTFDETKMKLSTDSLYNSTPYSASLDTGRRKLTIKTNWKENTKYHLVLQKDFAQDSLGRQLLKSDTLAFTTKKRSDYSNSVQIIIHKVDTAGHPVLQFIQNNEVVFAAPVSEGVFTATLFNPGEYELRILYDRNKNGIWDKGKFFGLHQQPEKVVPIGKKITIKPAIDNETEVSL
ncbi:MAG: hypothetical protein NVS9B7_22790 [Flavisolibacter sp.]